MSGWGCSEHRSQTAGCPTCRRANRVYDRRRRTAIVAGTWLPRVPAAEVSAHIEKLHAAGMSYRDITIAAGVGDNTPYHIIRYRKWVQGEVAAAILAVQPGPKPLRAGTIDATGTVRMIRAMAYNGWSLQHQAAELGKDYHQLRRWAYGHQKAIRVSTADAVRRLYDRLSMTHPVPGRHVTRVRAIAIRRGWVGPLAWDDETIDDPNAQPSMPEDACEVDESAVCRIVTGDLPAVVHRVDRIEALRRMHAAGDCPRLMAARLRMDLRAVQRQLQRLGLRTMNPQHQTSGNKAA